MGLLETDAEPPPYSRALSLQALRRLFRHRGGRTVASIEPLSVPISGAKQAGYARPAATWSCGGGIVLFVARVITRRVAVPAIATMISTNQQLLLPLLMLQRCWKLPKSC